MTCCRCKLEATFTSPGAFCNEHWAEWWAGLDPDHIDGELTDKEKAQMKREALQEMKRRGQS